VNRFSTQYLLTCAAIGAGGGLLLIPANNIAAAVAAALPLLYAAIVGVWVVPSVVALDLIRRPGASVLTSLFAGLVLIPFTPYGVRSVITCLIFGVILELPFLATLYRRWSKWIFFGATLVLLALYSLLAYRTYAVETFEPWAQFAFFGLMLVSAVGFTALALLLSGRLRKAGVARGLRRQSSTADAPAKV